jgi:hypothetical protein
MTNQWRSTYIVFWCFYYVLEDLEIVPSMSLRNKMISLSDKLNTLLIK